MALSDLQLATMNLMMSTTWALHSMMMNLPRKSVKAFAELQISCHGRFGTVHLAILLTSIPLRIHADKWIRIVALIELAERAAYYGVSGPFQNYIQNRYKSPSGLPGALGLGQSTATRLTNFFQFFCYVTPVFGLCSSLLLKCSKRKALTYCQRRYRGGLVPRQSQDNYLFLCSLYAWPPHTFYHISADCHREWLYLWRLDNSYVINWNVRNGLLSSAIMLTFAQRHWRYQIKCLPTHRRAVHRNQTKHSDPRLRWARNNRSNNHNWAHLHILLLVHQYRIIIKRIDNRAGVKCWVLVGIFGTCVHFRYRIYYPCIREKVVYRQATSWIGGASCFQSYLDWNMERI